MPRRPKTGLDYFQVDVNRRNDFKILDLLNEYGPLGYTVYDFCLQYIYANGYYFEAPLSQVVLLLVKDIGAKWVKNKDLVKQVIYYCAEIGLFDHALLQQNIITSVGVQRRYDSITVRNKADKSKYWLLDKNSKNNGLVSISAPETPENVAETPENVAETTQEKSREEKSREDNSSFAPPDDESSDEADEEIFITIPMTKKQKHKVTASYLQHYKELYPAVDVEKELLYMVEWFNDHPQNKKASESGIKSFITRWLKKAQNQGGRGYGFHQGHSGGSGNTGSSGYTNPNVL